MSSSRPSRLSQLIPRLRNRTPLSTTPSSSTSNPIDSSAGTSTAIASVALCPQGLEIISEGDDPVIDIVAVHGLNGHRQNTWTASNGTYWLHDFLPHDIPNARIFSWGYDARTHASSGLSCQYLYDHARSLISDLRRKRKLSNSMEHSLGGIVVKSVWLAKPLSPAISSHKARDRSLL